MEMLSLQQMLKISHTLGIDLFNAVISNRKKDKILPTDFYRNRYQAEKCELFDELVNEGIAEKSEHLGLNFYNITEKGIELFKIRYYQLVTYKKPKERDLQYLKSRINFYCDFYDYRFGGDNSEHIIEYYQKYYLCGEYVSHTTKDVINRFKSELKLKFKKIK